jgi:hypothetical protein
MIPASDVIAAAGLLLGGGGGGTIIVKLTRIVVAIETLAKAGAATSTKVEVLEAKVQGHETRLAVHDTMLAAQAVAKAP